MRARVRSVSLLNAAAEQRDPLGFEGGGEVGDLEGGGAGVEGGPGLVAQKEDGPAAALLEMATREVARDDAEPGAEELAAPEFAPLPVRGEEGFLDEILGRGGVPDHGPDVRQQPPAVLLDDAKGPEVFAGRVHVRLSFRVLSRGSARKRTASQNFPDASATLFAPRFPFPAAAQRLIEDHQ